MKRLTNILFLLVPLWCLFSFAQTPYDSFAPEISRPMLDVEFIRARDAYHAQQAITTDTLLYIVDMRDGSIIDTISLTDELRKWLSVDPLADKYPNISPYAYCSWNPISRIDPDGRADYYDGDGNHLCNDGVDDRKVYQQSDKGDVVLGGYATPFSYVGEVDKISLSYEGEMTSICKSKGELTVTQHVGEKQFSKSFDAVSDSNGKKGPLYTLQNGDYICYDYIPNVSQEGYVKDGIGFKIRLRTDGWDTQRTDLQIHPDQYPPGTLGCIGLTGTASDLSLFQKMVSPFTSGGKTSPLSVSIIGNPQCCRAANYDKGLPALFCK